MTLKAVPGTAFSSDSGTAWVPVLSNTEKSLRTASKAVPGTAGYRYPSTRVPAGTPKGGTAVPVPDFGWLETTP
jgi:hypothetical protein